MASPISRVVFGKLAFSWHSELFIRYPTKPNERVCRSIWRKEIFYLTTHSTHFIYGYMGEREMFYLTTHSTHFIYGYMASDIWLRTILIVRKETRCRHIGYSFRLAARVLLYAPSHRQDNTCHGLCYTSRGALAGTTVIWRQTYDKGHLR